MARGVIFCSSGLFFVRGLKSLEPGGKQSDRVRFGVNSIEKRVLMGVVILCFFM